MIEIQVDAAAASEQRLAWMKSYFDSQMDYWTADVQ
jgi:hypothetical protein